VAANKRETSLSKTADFPDIADLSYERARDELISIVAQLEGGQIGLEDSMTLWQRGEALAKHCNTWLDGAEAKLSSGPPAGSGQQD
jgi:exodeoxyribonuclease VII small subunit